MELIGLTSHHSIIDISAVQLSHWMIIIIFGGWWSRFPESPNKDEQSGNKDYFVESRDQCQSGFCLILSWVSQIMLWSQDDQDDCAKECKLTCISGSSLLSSPICLSLSLMVSHSLWYFRLNTSSSPATVSAPGVESLDFFGKLPSRLGCSSSSSHWNFSSRRS